MKNEKEFKIYCPNCGQHLSYDSTMFDQVFQCPACGKEVRTPSMPDPEPAPVVINVVRRGNGGEKRTRLLLVAGIASAAVVVVMILAVVRAISFFPVLFGPDQEDMSEDSQPTTEQTAYSSDDDESVTTQEYETPTKPPQSYARNQKVLTDSEKLAMGRVMYAFYQIETSTSQFAEMGKTEEESVIFQYLASLSGEKFLLQVSTDGCPEDFANAWKGFALWAALVQRAEGEYNVMRHALKNGQYVDRDSLQKMAELEEKLPEARRIYKESMEKFLSVCQNYGLENLKRWSLEASQH